jgi:hypothetical protein
MSCRRNALLRLPECEPIPAIDALEADGWTVHAATWQANGHALMSRGGTWAIGRWEPIGVEPQESERAARNAFDRELPDGVPRVSRGS